MAKTSMIILSRDKNEDENHRKAGLSRGGLVCGGCCRRFGGGFVGGGGSWGER
ncbi:hypothetical protein [Scytonema sp. PCC 10023]|uniref:hypothetical protein n=1 Tax=Scytonema sp. PCC 10023 TaxID=1680591 RepID=UPI0039C62A09